MDPNLKEKGGEEEILPSHDQQEMIKTVKDKCCVDCSATKTPLWRSGPAGPKTLCNACGIRYRKKRAGTATATATVDLKNKEEEKIKGEKETTMEKKRRVNIRNGKCGKLNVEWRPRLMALGERDVLFQRRRSQLKKRQRFYKKFGEVEQAAVLLMALSCGSVFA